MKNKLRVLSIDFDFFQKVDLETILNYYPDGIDLPTSMSTLIWSTRYKNIKTKQQITKVKINEKKFKDIQKILEKNPTAKCMITQSHVNIYDFIMKNYVSGQGIQLFHLDMHHDMFNDNNDLDCGNWISFLKNSVNKLSVLWYPNDISEKMYGIEDLHKTMMYDLNLLVKEKFDLIFLCRSDNWVPPHLDIYFEQLKNKLIETCGMKNIVISKDIRSPRKIEEFSI